MFETLLRLYKAGKISESGLEKAVEKGWISKEQKNIIIGGWFYVQNFVVHIDCGDDFFTHVFLFLL